MLQLQLKEEVFVYETKDQLHTSEYLAKFSCDLISSCESQYGCNMKSFVADNAANMAIMSSIEKKCCLKY